VNAQRAERSHQLEYQVHERSRDSYTAR